eukprot:CAMPEP_0204832636 /NCGR_PEP_ID=MMETSP1346-20131115/14306_1 /ASSEMBLY_ACC=CAM_ASM_000771 /TAXON_ID=215587 /ORGANISM="Aplanochytrium stocchinoi, Strain GSBS06" /LENGTH=211 /DNA_ID=CAMNT_0051964581 /DNA_START=53 /DNA_END=688 /DNA_ORIENTATION=-
MGKLKAAYLIPVTEKALIGIDACLYQKTREMVGNADKLASLLQNGQFEQATALGEHMMKDDWKVDCLELLKTMTLSIQNNAALLENTKKLSDLPDVEQDAVKGLIYAESRMGVKELAEVVRVLKSKYGSKLITIIKENRLGSVNPILVSKLGDSKPDAPMISSYLEEIANAYNVNWQPDASINEKLHQQTLQAAHHNVKRMQERYDKLQKL